MQSKYAIHCAMRPPPPHLDVFVAEVVPSLQETQRLMQEPVPGISAVPDEANARYFHVVVAGSTPVTEFPSTLVPEIVCSVFVSKKKYN